MPSVTKNSYGYRKEDLIASGVEQELIDVLFCFGIPTRVYHVVMAHKIKSISDITKYSEREFGMLNGVGQHTFKQIKYLIEARGFRFKSKK
jgi:DNA-directed RNA polymerase alpha subunit